MNTTEEPTNRTVNTNFNTTEEPTNQSVSTNSNTTELPKNQSVSTNSNTTDSQSETTGAATYTTANPGTQGSGETNLENSTQQTSGAPTDQTAPVSNHTGTVTTPPKGAIIPTVFPPSDGPDDIEMVGIKYLQRKAQEPEYKEVDSDPVSVAIGTIEIAILITLVILLCFLDASHYKRDLTRMIDNFKSRSRVAPAK